MRYTQKDLGIQSDLNDLYISQLERGVAIPSIPCLFKISSVLKQILKNFLSKNCLERFCLRKFIS